MFVKSNLFHSKEVTSELLEAPYRIGCSLIRLLQSLIHQLSQIDNCRAAPGPERKVIFIDPYNINVHTKFQSLPDKNLINS